MLFFSSDYNYWLELGLLFGSLNILLLHMCNPFYYLGMPEEKWSHIPSSYYGTHDLCEGTHFLKKERFIAVKCWKSFQLTYTYLESQL